MVEGRFMLFDSPRWHLRASRAIGSFHDQQCQIIHRSVAHQIVATAGAVSCVAAPSSASTIRHTTRVGLGALFDLLQRPTVSESFGRARRPRLQ